MATEDFHQSAKDWAQIKHTLLAKYLQLFIGKTGKGRSRVFYIDAFAGPGLLDDGTKGSALYAAEVAARPVQHQRRDTLHCINIEADADTFEKLEKATTDYVRDGFVTNLLGKFEDRRDEVLRKIGPAPALFFIDPFGTQGAELNSLKALKNGRAIREAFVRYDDTRVKRLLSWAANNCDGLDPSAKKTAEAYRRRASNLTSDKAIKDWLDDEPDARQALINGYIAEAKRQEIFQFGIAYPIRNPDTRGHRYFLVHLSDFPDGYTWMANFMAAAEIEYEELHDQFRFGGQPGLITVKELMKAARAGMVDKIIERLPSICTHRKWQKGTEVEVRRVYAALVDEFQWHASRSEWQAALRRLRASGGIKFQDLKDGDSCTWNLVP